MAVKTEDVKTTVKDLNVNFQGTQIILPVINGKPMPYDEAIEWLKRKREEAERDVGVHYELPYFPLDGAVALHKALAITYGWADLVPSGFWGTTPPYMIGVPVSVDEKIQVPWGRVQIPGIAGHIETSIAFEPTPRFVINGKVKQKHAADIKALVDLTEKILKEGSIYKGKAIKVSFEWQRLNQSFDPQTHCPKFMPLKGMQENDLIFGKNVQNAIDIGLFAPIENAKACRKYGVPLKRGVLLYGPYGTGKTLTANVTALKAIRNDFTFVYLEDVRDLKKGLQFASQYAPAVLFAEDIDRVITGERSVSMDEVLNTLDGVDTKGGEIITVFTTNHVENINPAMLRMGRLDTLVKVEEPDAEAASKLVQLYGRGLFAKNVSFSRIGEALKGKIPAFIRETTERAKIAAIARLGDNIEGQVLEEDVLAAAAAMQVHADMLVQKDTGDQPECELLFRVPANHSRTAKSLISKLSRNGDGTGDDD